MRVWFARALKWWGIRTVRSLPVVALEVPLVVPLVVALVVTLSSLAPVAVALASPANGGSPELASWWTTSPDLVLSTPVGLPLHARFAPGIGDATRTSSIGLAREFIDDRGQREDGRPTRGRVILYSALVPGLGQLKWGAKPAAVGFMLGEVASWTSLITFRQQGSLRQDRYIEYAERFAGVQDADGESNQYYQALGRYDRSDPGPGSYNEIEVRMVAKRELFPHDRAAQERYIAENSIGGERAWNWESAARRLEYASIRSSSESSYHRADFAIGGLVAGRILSLMHAIWLTADHPDSNERDDDLEQSPPAEEQSLTQALRPYIKTSLDGACRFGICARF